MITLIESFRFKSLLLAISTIILLCFCSCGDDDDPIYSNIVGPWYGTRTYYNPAGGTKYQYLTIRFESNGTGSLEYEAPTSYSAAFFTYKVKNKIIKCKGAYADTYGEIEGDFELELRIEGDRLIPQNKYDVFILTKDNSVITDGEGKEIVDDSELIYGVWKHTSGEVVLVLSDTRYTEYTLMSGSSNIYSKKTEGSFSYNSQNKNALINGSRFNVILLTETVLQLMSESGNIFNYERGSNADIPTNGDNSTNYKSLLENSRLGWYTDDADKVISFNVPNKVHFLNIHPQKIGSEHINLLATGTYSLSGKTINCIFDYVYWSYSDTYTKDFFPGWTCGKTNYKDFIIEELSVERLKLKIDGKTYYFHNADIRD